MSTTDFGFEPLDMLLIAAAIMKLIQILTNKQSELPDWEFCSVYFIRYR